MLAFPKLAWSKCNHIVIYLIHETAQAVASYGWDKACLDYPGFIKLMKK